LGSPNSPKIGLNIVNFSELRNEGYVYVDKTKFVHDILSGPDKRLFLWVENLVAQMGTAGNMLPQLKTLLPLASGHSIRENGILPGAGSQTAGSFGTGKVRSLRRRRYA
jgi:hypothetical protein